MRYGEMTIYNSSAELINIIGMKYNIEIEILKSE